MPIANHLLATVFVPQLRPFVEPLLNRLLNGLSQQFARPFRKTTVNKSFPKAGSDLSDSHRIAEPLVCNHTTNRELTKHGSLSAGKILSLLRG